VQVITHTGRVGMKANGDDKHKALSPGLALSMFENMVPALTAVNPSKLTPRCWHHHTSVQGTSDLQETDG